MNSLVSKTYTLTGPKALMLKEELIEFDAINSNQILCETFYTAISPGTETAAFLGVEPLRHGSIYPRVVGYCNVAQVIVKGKSFIGIEEGDFILTFQSHKSHFILNSSEFFIKLPQGDPKQFVNAYLYHLGYHSLLTANITSPKSKIAILGGGVLGYTTALMSEVEGFETSIFSNQQDLKKKLENNNIFFFQKLPLDAKNSENPNFDCVVNTSNTWEDWEFALKIAGKQSQIINLGFPGRGQNLPKFNPLDPKCIYAKSITIKPLCVLSEMDENDPNSIKKNLYKIINLIQNEIIMYNDLFTHEIDYEQLEHQYLTYEKRNTYLLSTLIHWKK